MARYTNMGRKYLAAVGGYTLFVFVLTHIPHMPKQTLIRGGDKIAHVGLYMPLGVLLFLYFWNLVKSPAYTVWMWTVLLGLFIGTIDEFTQRFVPGRESSIWDAAADMLGVVVGILIALVVLKIKGEDHA